jgi:hypothetical protein
MINFANVPGSHQCTSHIENGCIVWRCPYCEGYERRLNVSTGEMTVKGKTDFPHQGGNVGKTDVSALTKGINLN